MKTFQLLFVLGLIAILAQPVASTTYPDNNTPPNRGDCRQ